MKPLLRKGRDIPFRDWKDRSLSRETLQKYGVWFEGDGTVRYPLTSSGEHVSNKVRNLMATDKKERFFHEGNPSDLDLFGQVLFPPGGKAITVYEGQDDAMAGFEMTGSRFPCVSVHSAAVAERDIRNNFEYLNSFDKVVLCFDNDKAGMEAQRRVCNLAFPPGKLKIMSLTDFKDANDYKINNKVDLFTKAWFQAPEYRPDGIKLGTDLWEETINRPNHFQVPYPFEGLNRMTYGIRLSEFVTLTADSGVGKTSIIKHIEHSLLTNPDVVEKGYGVGFLHLEEPNGDTVLGLLSVHNSKPYHLPDCERTEDELRVAFDSVVNNERFVIWDHFGSNTIEAVLDKVRHMHALGCRYIVLDHLSIIVSDQSGDERKQLDEITTKLKTLCMELNIAIIAVIHQNRNGQIRGTAGVEQLSNMVIKLERNKTDPDPWRRNVTKLTIEKNRFCGRSGPSCWLWYNEATGRLVELDDEEQLTYENGGSVNNPEDVW